VYLVIKIVDDGELQPSLNWYHNGEPIEEDYAHEIEGDGSLVLPCVGMNHSGTYKLVVSNEHGLVEKEVKLIVREELLEMKTEMATAQVSEIVYTRPIPVSNFVKYVAELHTDMNQPLKDLFQVSVYGLPCPLINQFGWSRNVIVAN
jgi:hypothetical protein